MQCPSCGITVSDDANFCPNCRAELPAVTPQSANSTPSAASAPAPAPAAAPQPAQQAQPAQPAQPVQPGYQPVQQQFPPANPNFAAQQQFQQQQPYNNVSPVAAAVPDRSTMYTIIAVLEIIFAGGLLAIIPLVMSIQYKNAYASGDMMKAAQKEKSARIALIVVGIIGILATIAVFSGALE